MTDDILLKAGDALLALAAERPWRQITLREIAERAEVDFPTLYASANSKRALLAHVSERFDGAALATAATASADVHDRLFDAAMARIEAMEPRRAALTAILDAGLIAVLPQAPRTARAILEAAGVDATPPRLAAMTATWARIVQVWRADEGALNRTMAEIDQRLKQMRERSGRIGAGF
jgi:AcrR family transcriptional regulator